MATIKYQTASGATFDVSDVEYMSEVDLQNAIDEELEALDEINNDYTIIDYDGIPDRFISKGELDPEYFEFIDIVNSSNLGEENLLIALDNDVSLGDLAYLDADAIPDRFIDKGELDPEYFEFMEAVNNSSYGEDVFLAGLECGLSLDQIEEAYQGLYSSDEDFAQELADQLGYIDRNVSWPYTCIDWEHAARELMYDYVCNNCHYFRCV